MMAVTASSAALRGFIWMIVATGFQALASGLVRKLSLDFGIFQLVLFFSSISVCL